ncbi:MAG: DEAD/DEAH box helicase [Chitinophagaceae bacterium]|nr:DEAD/DEAH box helicase [Chitinophagaceae bacterium]
MLDITETDNGYEVKFAYKPYLVTAIKKIPGARFNGGKKHWWVPASSGNALLNWAGVFGAKAKPQTVIEIGEIDPLPELTVDIPLKKQMFTFQGRGVAYNLIHKRVIVGDQPGLGKTAQAIATVEAADCKCVLVICPATIRENWKREIEDIWTNKKALILTDRVKTTWPTFYKVGMIKYFICNYESLKKYFVEEINKPEDKPMRLNHIKFRDTIDLFDAVIIDEIHRCKDGKTQQSKFVMGIARGKEYVLALTGTPVVNKPIDLVPQLHIIGHLASVVSHIPAPVGKDGKLGDVSGYKRFVDRFCQGWNQASNLKELNYMLHKHCFYRREKSEVLKDLPDKMRSILKCDIENRPEYSHAENEFKNFLKSAGFSSGQIDKSMRAEALVKMMLLKKLSARGKINEVVEHVKEVVEAGEKIVVFAWHREIVYALKEAIPGAVTIVGDDSMDQRQRAVDGFQNNPKVQVIICNIKSGGVGITLTASSRVAFIELPWHPADGEQCEDRCHRIGQKDSVQCSYFLGINTIDEYIYEIIEKKRLIVNQVTGGEDNVETVERNIVDELIGIFSKQNL